MGKLYKWVNCPCCGFPTLTEPSSHEICELCHWQDDGLTGTNEEEVIGGPNGLLSIAQARRNFVQHGDAFDAADTRRRNLCRDPNRKRLLRYVDDLWLGWERFDRKKFEELLLAV